MVHEGVQRGHPVVEWPRAAVGPVPLGLDTGSGQEAQLRLGGLVGPELDDPPTQAGVRTRVAIVVDELANEDRRPQVRAGSQAALDVGERRGGQLGRTNPWPIARRCRSRWHIALGRPPVSPNSRARLAIDQPW
jgi:hypothetical protein